MDAMGESDLRQICRICVADVSDEAASHSLIENDEVTGLGEKFISCLGIQVSCILVLHGYRLVFQRYRTGISQQMFEINFSS